MGSIPHKKIRIAIAGGGTGGLALAIGLSNMQHLDVTVYEATREYRDVGQGLAMHANAIAAMETIDPEVLAAWREASALAGSPEEADAISSTTVSLAWGPNMGAVVAELGQAKARKTISRSDLLFELLEVLKRRGAKVELGKRMNEIHDLGDSVKINFEDGSEATADCLIGCEGANSKTREFLLGPNHPATPVKTQMNYVSIRSQVSMEQARPIIDEDLTRNASIRIGPQGYTVTMPVKKGSMLQIGSTFVAEQGQDPKTVEFPVHKFDDYNEHFRKLLKLGLEQASPHRLFFWDHDPAPSYYRNRVCMTGDAAHCTTPFAGNGAAQALEDAAVLKALFARLRSPDQISAAFGAYDQVRRPRSQKVVKISRTFGRAHMMLDPPDHNLEEIRRIYREGASFCNHADIPAQNREVVRIFESSC